MAKKRDTCKRGHDLTDANNRRADGEGCRICKSMALEALRGRRDRPALQFSSCTACARPKFRDHRPVCLSCAAVDRYEIERKEQLLRKQLAMTIKLECAPAWVKRGSEADKRRWLGLPSTLPLRLVAPSDHNDADDSAGYADVAAELDGEEPNAGRACGSSANDR